jgi:hypothetical protein
VREIGHNLYAWSYAHTVKVDREDNIWVTDKGSDMVIKFNPEGRVVMVFGRKQEASDDGTGPSKDATPPLPPEDGLFRQVTDIAWDRSDDAYISDGYINSRIAKVDKTGQWIKSWGEPRSGPGQLRIALRSTQRKMSTWRIAATAESRCSMAGESFCARSPSTCLSITVPVRQSATSANSRIRQGLRVHLGRSALHPRRIK